MIYSTSNISSAMANMVDTALKMALNVYVREIEE